ncbi:MAG: PD-(D/E)XK nuclease family protein, partial [Stellaceae bacterium]
TSRSSAQASAPPDPPNLQTREVFAAEATAINDAVSPLVWLRPSDQDQMPIAEIVAVDISEDPEVETPVGPGRVRGLILHKLMEEILTGGVAEAQEQLADRAEVLLRELDVDPAGEAAAPSKDEISATALETLRLPGIAALRPAHAPELTVYGMLDGGKTALAGRADASAPEDGPASVVLDWKSDVVPRSEDVQAYAGQLRHYMPAIGAPRGALGRRRSSSVMLPHSLRHARSASQPYKAAGGWQCSGRSGYFVETRY